MERRTIGIGGEEERGAREGAIAAMLASASSFLFAFYGKQGVVEIVEWEMRELN